jgi:CDP-archaeol synthase
MHYVAVAQVLVLLSLANGSPVIAKRIFGETYAGPVDGNARFVDGRPLLGPSKTIRGIVISLVVTALGAMALGLQFWLGLLVASTAMAGDLFSSFMKRRLHLASSSKVTGLDQIPESLFPLLACRSVLSLTALDRSGLCDFLCRPNTTLASVFLAAMARPPLLMRRLPPHAAGDAK